MRKENLKRSVEVVWEKDKIGYRPFELLLRGIACLYRPAVFTRNRLYDLGILRRHRLPCPVVAVGNIAVGGTGKTPMVIYLARQLKAEGLRPAVLSRGYLGKAKAPVNIVADGKRVLMKPEDCGDEPFLIAKSLDGVPVLTGPRRVETGRCAIEEFGADILILDDAFQHRQLVRDVDIVLLPAERPLGNGLLFPAGSLRETSAALMRADMIVRTGFGAEEPVAVPKPTYRAHLKAVGILNAATGRSAPLADLDGRTVCAFSGIASPRRFEKTLRETGAQIVDFIVFPDHHPYSREDVREIQKRAEEKKADMIVTTEKDGVKLNRFHMFLEKIHLLQVEMALIPDDRSFAAALREKLSLSPPI